MLGRRERRRPELFVAGSLRGLVPDDHILARVGRVLGLGWLRSEVEPLYRAAAGRPAIARRHAGAVAAANGEEGQGQAVSGEAPPDGDPPAEPGPGRAAVCTTDPDAPLVKDRQARRGEPADKQHTAVDGRAGVVLDVAVTTGRGRRPRRPRSRRSSTPSRPSRAARSGSRRWTRPTPSPGCSPRWRGARSRRWRPPKPRRPP